MSTPITELPIATTSIADMSGHADAVGVRIYGVKDGSDAYCEAGAAGGLATLGSDKRVPDNQLPETIARKKDMDGLARDRNTVTALENTGGIVAIDCSRGDYFTLAIDAEVTAWEFENIPAACSLMIRITQGATAYAVTMPTTKFTGDATVVSTEPGAVDVLAVTTFDGGAEWIATLAGVASAA